MKQRILYIFYYLKHIHHKLRSRFTGSYNTSGIFLGKKAPSDEEANELIKTYLKSGKPFALCRMGSAEFSEFQLYEEHRLFHTNRMDRSNMFESFHHDEKEVKRWVDLIKKDNQDIDIMAYFDDHPAEEYMVKTSCPKTMKLIRLSQLEPLTHSDPWTMELAGKKVLIVNPFVDTMLEQYPKMDLLFPNRNVLPPDIQFKTFPAVWFLGRNDDFDTWFDALDYMYLEIMKIDFDVALLSCSAFGYNLAPRLKRAGKQAIQMGGSLQILFGIWGARWDDYPPYVPLKNEHWVRPPKTVAPKDEKGMEELDNACYW